MTWWSKPFKHMFHWHALVILLFTWHACNPCGPVLLRSCCAITVVRGLHGEWRKLDELCCRGQLYEKGNSEEERQVSHGGVPDFEDHVQPSDSEATEGREERHSIQKEWRSGPYNLLDAAPGPSWKRGAGLTWVSVHMLCILICTWFQA